MMTTMAALSSPNTNNDGSMNASYDPMYCLMEHLDYFNTSVAGKHQLLTSDFDEIFDGTVCVVDLPVRSSTPTNSLSSPPPSLPTKTKIISPPASPKSVMSMALITSDVCVPKPMMLPKSKCTQPAKKSRKRRMSEEVSGGEEDKEDVRRERNRQHAKRSRLRKKEFTQSLEQSMQELREENAKLFQLLGVSPQETAGVVQEREAALDVTANEAFIEALQKPQNRVLSDDALESLRAFFH